MRRRLPSFVARDVRRIVDERGGEKDREQADGNIDEEDPAPRIVVGDPAAQGGANDGSDDNAHAVDGHGHALLFGRKAFDQNGLRDGLQAAATGALQDAEENKHGQGWEQSRRETN